MKLYYHNKDYICKIEEYNVKNIYKKCTQKNDYYTTNCGIEIFFDEVNTKNGFFTTKQAVIEDAIKWHKEIIELFEEMLDESI